MILVLLSVYIFTDCTRLDFEHRKMTLMPVRVTDVVSGQNVHLPDFRNFTAELENIHPIHPSIRETAFFAVICLNRDGWDRWMDKSEFSYKIPGEINASMPQKPLTCLPREFVMWLSCSRPNSSECFFRVMLTVRAASGL